MDFPVFLTGLTTGLSLIVAIGAQNAFVLRQGLKGRHVFAVCLACAVSDLLLISLGVAGFGRAVGLLPWLDPLMRMAGAGFLLWYGGRSLWSALRSDAALQVSGAGEEGLSQVLLSCLALTWMNPHVYLDTLVLLGAISTQFPGAGVEFGAGAAAASFLFFFALGYGARWLRPLFAQPVAWRVLEAGIALAMWGIALRLVLGG